jgi:hypothetical protein
MAFIRMIPPEEAKGKLRELYDEDLKTHGYVRTVTMALSMRPEAIAAWRRLNTAIQSTMDPRHYLLVTIAAAARLQCSL